MADNMISAIKVLGKDISLATPMPEADVKASFFPMLKELDAETATRAQNMVLSFRTEGTTLVAFREDAVFG